MSRRACHGWKPSSGSTCSRASASGFVAATSSISTPPSRREHEERLLRAAVERDREVVLLRDVGGLLDPELARRRGRGCRGRGSSRACCSASAGSSASLTPPALPRPPVSTCALTTTWPPSSSAAAPRLLRRSSRAVLPRPGCRSAGRAPCPGTRKRSTGRGESSGRSASDDGDHLPSWSPAARPRPTAA